MKSYGFEGLMTFANWMELSNKIIFALPLRSKWKMASLIKN
jgi:hypothetical protein